jgi:anti-sigma regulatory factor (Ser/Thr protein kinase)
MKLELRETLTTDPEQVAYARQLVAGYLRDLGSTEEEVAVLLVSELVTNAILHASGPLELRARPLDEGLRIEVLDAAPEAPTLRTDVDLTDVGGRGLQLVDVLADRWGWSESDAGKVVWFELDS